MAARQSAPRLVGNTSPRGTDMSDHIEQAHNPIGLKDPTVEQADCCIVGGGPAGALLALLLARQGVGVMLLEAHGDFNRDFRGDALQPVVLQVLAQIGLAERVLALALARISSFPVHTPSGSVQHADVRRLKTPYPFITMV